VTEDEIRNETPEDDEVEAHGLKETAAGMSAAAMLAAGAGTASAATPTGASANAKPAANADSTFKYDRAGATQKPDFTIKLGKRADATIKQGKKGDAVNKLQKKGESVRPDYFLKTDRSE
jgi:hypothetical protein